MTDTSSRSRPRSSATGSVALRAEDQTRARQSAIRLLGLPAAAAHQAVVRELQPVSGSDDGCVPVPGLRNFQQFVIVDRVVSARLWKFCPGMADLVIPTAVQVIAKSENLRHVPRPRCQSPLSLPWCGLRARRNGGAWSVHPFGPGTTHRGQGHHASTKDPDRAISHCLATGGPPM